MDPGTLLRTSPGARAGAVGALAAGAGVLSAVAMASGPGLTVDSVRYAAAARGVAASLGAIDIDGGPFTLYPPGLPAIVGTLMRSGLSLESATAVVNIVAVVAMVVASYWLGAVALRSTTIALLPAAVVGVATPTVMLFSRLWSEPLFAVLTLLVLILGTRAVMQRSLSATTALALAAASSAAVWIRYIGITLIPIVALAAALAVRGRGARRMVVVGLAVGTLGAAGAVAVVARNLSLGSDPFGSRVSAGSTVGEFLVDTVATLGSYVIPQPAAVLALPAGVLIGALVAYGGWRAVVARDAGMALIVAFIAVYWSALLVIGLATTIEYMRYRLAAPVFAPLVILAVYGARHAWRQARGSARTALRIGGAALLVLVLPVALVQSAAYSVLVGRSGHGYASDVAQASELARAVGELPPDARVATNALEHLYWVTGRTARTYGDALRDPGTVEYLAVFRSVIPGTTTPADIDPAADGLDVSTVAELADGTLYRVAATR